MEPGLGAYVCEQIGYQNHTRGWDYSWRNAPNQRNNQCKRPTNKKGIPYPTDTNPATDEEMPFSSGDREKVPLAKRTVRDNQGRYNYIKTWYDKGYDTPEGG